MKVAKTSLSQTVDLVKLKCNTKNHHSALNLKAHRLNESLHYYYWAPPFHVKKSGCFSRTCVQCNTQDLVLASFFPVSCGQQLQEAIKAKFQASVWMLSGHIRQMHYYHHCHNSPTKLSKNRRHGSMDVCATHAHIQGPGSSEPTTRRAPIDFALVATEPAILWVEARPSTVW